MGIFKTILISALLGLSQLALADSVAVRVAPVLFSNHSKMIVSSGVVRPVSEQTLSFKVPGFLKSVRVQEGQYVTKGQLLASLELEEIDAQVAKAKAMLKDAQRKLDRLTKLESQQLASNEQIRQAKTHVDIAQSELTIASFNRKYAQIHAPANGRILSRHIEINELVITGQPIFVFADEEQGWAVRLSVADVDVVKLNINDQAEVLLDAYPMQIFKAKIRDIAGKAHPISQTFQVELALQGEQKLYSGLVAHTQITPSLQSHVAKIPMSALIQATGLKAKVYVLNSNQEAVLSDIQLAYFDEDYAYVKHGLTDRDQVVVEGGAFIRNGKDIAILNL